MYIHYVTKIILLRFIKLLHWLLEKKFYETKSFMIYKKNCNALEKKLCCPSRYFTTNFVYSVLSNIHFQFAECGKNSEFLRNMYSILHFISSVEERKECSHKLLTGILVCIVTSKLNENTSYGKHIFAIFMNFMTTELVWLFGQGYFYRVRYCGDSANVNVKIENTIYVLSQILPIED